MPATQCVELRGTRDYSAVAVKVGGLPYVIVALVWSTAAYAQSDSSSTGSTLSIPDTPPEVAPIETQPAPKSDEPADEKTTEPDEATTPAPTDGGEPAVETAPKEPPPSVETLPPPPTTPPPKRSSIEVVLPTHGCLDSGDTTVQLLSVLYENFAGQPGAVNVTSAGFPTLRHERTYVFPERDSTRVLDTRDFIANQKDYAKTVLAEQLPVLVNVQELAFQYPYDPNFDTLAGIERNLAPSERFPLTTRRMAKLTRYTKDDIKILVLEIEGEGPLPSDVTDYVPELVSVIDVASHGDKTTFYTLGRQTGRISRVWAETEADRTRVKNPAMLVAMGDIFTTRMTQENLDFCGATARKLGFTAAVPVQSELGLGPDLLQKLAQRHGLPFIAANLFRKDSNANDFRGRPFPRFILQERDGVTVAFIGVVDPSELDVLPTSVRSQWRFEDMTISVGRVIDELRTYLRRRPDLTVVLVASRDPSPLTRIEGVDMVIGPPVNTNIDPMRRVTEVPETPSELEITYGSGALVVSQPPWRAVTRLTTNLVRTTDRRRSRPVRIIEERVPVLEEGPIDPEIEKRFRIIEEKSLIADAKILVPGARSMLDRHPDLENLVWGEHILHRRGYRRAPPSQPARYSDPLWMRLVTDVMVDEMRTDIAISYNIPREWDILGPISRQTVGSWLRTGDSVQVVKLTGQELMPIIARLKRQVTAEDWPASQVLFWSGVNPMTSIIRGRAIDPRQPYLVAVSESVLTGREFADVFANKKPYPEKPLLRTVVTQALEEHSQDNHGAVEYVDRMLEDQSTKVVRRWSLFVNQLSLSASQYNNSQNTPNFQFTKETRLNSQASTQFNINVNVAGVYDTQQFTWQNTVRLIYGRLIARNDTNFNGRVDERISQETADDLVLSSELRLNVLQFGGQLNQNWRTVPFINAAYDTEVTPTDGQRRQRLGRAVAGIVSFPGPKLRELRIGALVQEDFSQDKPFDTNYGIAAGYSIIVPLYGTMRLESTLDLRYLFSDGHDTSADLALWANDVTRILYPFWQQKLSFFVSVDLFVAHGKTGDLDIVNNNNGLEQQGTASTNRFAGSWILGAGLDFSGVLSARH